ncbi:MAG: DNA translocase FtsK [Desulfovibrio sp.]|nr:DNA translocase FtsK [Desulfovibrio sp.]
MIGLELLFDFSWFTLASGLWNRILALRNKDREELKPGEAATLLLPQEETSPKNRAASLLSAILAMIPRKKDEKPLPMPELFDQEKESAQASQNAPNENAEGLFQPPTVLFKETTDEEDILELSTSSNGLNDAGAEKETTGETNKEQAVTAESEKKEEKKEEKDEKKKKENKEEETVEQEEPVSQEETAGTDGDVTQAIGEKRSLGESFTSDTPPATPKKTSGFSLSSLFGKKEKTPRAEETKKPEPPKNRAKGPYPLPPFDLLRAPEPVKDTDREGWQEKANVLMETLSEFSIEGDLVAVTPGPVVTLFEVRPAKGVRVNKFVNIGDDIARVLKAPSVRIISPVPGKDTVGVEIPNNKREFVNFRELVEKREFREAESPLTMVLGKDTAGKPLFADLARMPHMLIAGATGTGKSVCLNSILASFLYRAQPSELKLLLIDPKRVEMSVYADEPHLIHPVVNEPANAKNALEWATEEMDRRFKNMALLGVRNIVGFNKRLATLGDNRPDELADLEPLPYIAIVIDELADLMMMADRKDVENSIVRLAQLARACGIHMILATQRPSVNVVTGIIKANFPCRISFQVAGIADSRTILDMAGAEKLLGRGDMLYRPGDTTVKRLHGAFLSDDEVTDIVNFWKSQAQPSYKVDFSRFTSDEEGGRDGGDSSNEDDLFNDVLDFVTREGTASISKIQRRFKIGFNRAARLVEALEAQGIIDPADGSKPRKVRH